MDKEKKTAVSTNLDTVVLADHTIAQHENFYKKTVENSSGFSDNSERYAIGPLLGKGGMGEVYDAVDVLLDRPVAFKVMKGAVTSQAIEQFVSEAKITARLQHAGIVPIYDIGQTKNGSLYFAMKKITGATLGELIAEVYVLNPEDRWNGLKSEWSITRLLSVFHRICETLGYVHKQEVLHLDIKPSNIMISEHGEVYIVDWGLAKLLSEITQDESIIGTPMYMAPEQARGDKELFKPNTDVYGLGAVLYLILSGQKPYKGKAVEVLGKVLTESPMSITVDSIVSEEYQGVDLSLQTIGGHTIPKGLIDICTKAMSRDQSLRYESASELGKAIRVWMEGSERRVVALSLVSQAQLSLIEYNQLSKRSTSLLRRANTDLNALGSWASEEEKLPLWEQLDEAELIRNQAQVSLLRHESMLRSALSHVSDLESAHLALSEYYLGLHRQAELSKQSFVAQQRIQQLKEHASGIQSNQVRRKELEAYIEGSGLVCLSIAAKEASVVIFRYEECHRRLQPNYWDRFEMGSIGEYSLPMGSYLLEIQVQNRPTVHYPICIDRKHSWTCEAPEHHIVPITIPEELDENHCYVPGGWSIVGGDEIANGELPRRSVWIDGFVAMKHHVTNGDYILFLNELFQREGREAAFRYVPRERGVEERFGEMIFGFSEEGFFLQPDAEGDTMGVDWPVCMVDFSSAVAYSKWLSSRSGTDWRLPHEYEWEKAARGTDGRYFPWGNGFESSWCNMRLSSSRLLPVSIHAFPRDVSPYGLRHCAGNMCEWTSTPFLENGPEVLNYRISLKEQGDIKSFRGGSWINYERFTRLASRFKTKDSSRYRSLGFRLVYSLL